MQRNLIDYITKTYIYLFVLVVAGIFYRSCLHLFIIPRWIIEEEVFAHTVIELINTGTTLRIGYQPLLEQYLLYYIYLLTHLNLTILCQYANPIMGALTVIPVYFVLKTISTKNIALIGTTLWAFNENMIYRSSTFNSTEPLGFFLAMIALYIYLQIKDETPRNSKIKYFCLSLVILGISIFTHILPATFIIGLISLDLFLKGNIKQKLFVTIFLVGVLTFLMSPLNPHQVMMYSILPSTMLLQLSLSNIFLYSISDLMLGAMVFYGSVVLLGLTFIIILYFRPSTNIMYEYLFGCFLLFIFSWFFYSAYLIAPTRVIFYFALPLSFFVATVLSKLDKQSTILITGCLLFIMIFTSISGANTMLYIDNVMTYDEYEFLEQSIFIHNTHDFSDWWMDMPLKSSILLFSSMSKPTVLPSTFRLNEKQQIVINLNNTISTQKITTNPNGTITITTNPPLFKYILISPRMESSAYFHINTKYRTIQYNTPIVDVWKDLSDWELVEEYKNIKIYKWTGSD